MKWSEIIDPNILRFNYDREQRDRLNEVVKEFRGDIKTTWLEEDGPIEVCVFVPLYVNDEKEPVLVEVWEWDNNTVDKDSYKEPTPLRYDFFLGIIDYSQYADHPYKERFGYFARDIINNDHRLRYNATSLFGLIKNNPEDMLKKALNKLQKKAK